MSSAWVLALDTATEGASIALLRDGSCVEQVTLEAARAHGEKLYPQLTALLARHALSTVDIDLFACTSGPGSFAGVRVGLTLVKGLAETLGRACAGVSTLAAIAAGGEGPLRCPVLDARRGEVFTALYSDTLQVLREEVSQRWEEWRSGQDLIGAELLGVAPIEEVGNLRVVGPLAALAGKVAWERWQGGETGNALTLDANYVRRADAMKQWVDLG